MSERIERIGNSVIVYDDALVSQMTESVFGIGDSRDDSAGRVAGRGRVAAISVDGRPCILRHYFRGGLIRHFARDSFVWAGADATRSFREWRLLAQLRDRGLPVPMPVAARYIRNGARYTADLVTERLPDVESLSAKLRAGSLPKDQWRQIGALVAHFHRERVFHADLNAHNIQIGGAGDLHLLDFDRGRIMSGPGAWSRRNLQRLRRSLRKISRHDGANFSESDWQGLLDGYEEAMRRRRPRRE